MARQRKKSEYDYLIDEIYDYTDKVIGTLNRIYISHFNELKNISYQELNKLDSAVVNKVYEVYEQVDEKTRKYLLMLAKKVYQTIAEFNEFELVMEFMTMDWIIKELERYSPVTKYVYTHEVDRKRARMVEALVASETKAKEVETGLKQWSRQARSYVDIIVQDAIIKVYEDNNVKEVMWLTEDDEKVCVVCDDLDGMTFPIDKIPAPPHPNCRCTVEAVREWKD